MYEEVSPDGRTTAAEGDLRLPRPPGIIRRYWAHHPRLLDSIIAALYLLYSLISLSVTALEVSAWVVALGVVATLAVGFALVVWRRSRPVLLLFVTWGACIAMAPLAGFAQTAPIPFALYALAVYRSTRLAWVGFAGTIVVGTGAAMIGRVIRASAPDVFGAVVTDALSQYVVISLIAVLIGISIGNRRRYVDALVERANQLARERDQQKLLAAAEERSRIAREMHDIVSHSLTVMVTLADGSAAAVDAAPVESAEAMHRVAETGRAALTDMRRMLGVLGSSDAAELTPQPGTDDLGALIDTFRAAGLAVTLTTTGTPPSDPAEQLAIYRIVQESLTNALRHAARPTSVSVELTYERDGTGIRVSNDGAVAVARGTDGHGLVGMRQRVDLFGGTLESGPLPSGGWAVTARLPREKGTTS